MRYLKVIVILFICLHSAYEVHAQKSKEQIDQLVNEMFAKIQDRDFASVLEVTYPKIFDIVPKESMLEVLKMTFEGNDEYTFNFSKGLPKFNITDVVVDSESKMQYAFISYDLRMDMTFLNQTFEDDSKEMMQSIMKAQGMDVVFISDNTIDLTMKNALTIAINDELTKGSWMLLNYDADSPLFYQILPVTVIEKAKAYKQDLLLESAKQKKDE